METRIPLKNRPRQRPDPAPPLGFRLRYLPHAPGVPSGAGTASNDLELSEYVVRVEWIATRPASEAIWEKGMFANQNTVCELRSRFTLDRLLEGFGLDE